MVNFFVTIGLVCVLPFVVAMLEHGLNQSAHARRVSDRVAGGGERTARARERGVVHPHDLPGNAGDALEPPAFEFGPQRGLFAL